MRSAAGGVLLMATIGFLGQRGTGAARAGQAASVPTYGYQVVRSYPHDRAAFTQGIIFRNGVFYEGTGLNGRSSKRRSHARQSKRAGER